MRKAARRLAMLSAASAAALCLQMPPSYAQYYGDAPWCAVLQVGTGAVVWHCYYRSAEECAPNVVGGLRGSCNVNPYWTPAPGSNFHARPKYRQHYHG